MDLQHQVVWIVGASAGLGAALAREMQARGAQVAISARTESELELVAGGAMLVAPADVTDIESLSRAYARIGDHLGPPDIVMITAADARPMDIHTWEPHVFADIVNVSLIGASNVLSVVLPTMTQQRAGTIVGFVPPAAYRGLPTQAAYGAAKAGLQNLLESVTVEARPLGIDVVTVAPGGVRTDLAERSHLNVPASVSVDVAARAVCDGLERGQTHIAFPARLVASVEVLRRTPRALWPKLAQRLTER